MKIIKKYIIIGIIAVCLGFIYKFMPDPRQNRSDQLVVGTSADYPPYESVDVHSGKIVGFDIEIVEELAHRLNKKLIIIDMPFTSLIFGLLAGDIDMIAAGMSPTQNRAKLVSFTDKYLEGKPLVIFTKAHHFQPKNVTDLTGKIVTVNTGHIADNFMSTQPNVEIIRLDSAADSFMALHVGTVDAFVCALSTVQAFLQKQKNPEHYLYVPIENTGEHCAFAVDKSNRELLQNINKALQSMKADETLSLLQKKWGL